MSPAEHEFILLKERFKKAEEYEKTKYLTDAPEQQEIAEKMFERLVKRISEVWIEMTEEERKRHVDIFDS